MIGVQQTDIPLIVVAGPTASGKTGLAVELALRLGGEVISADSMQLYRDIPIQTAQPGEGERRGIPHHLMGILPLDASYSVARWLEEARRLIAEIHRRGKLPIVCGGTGLYITSLLQNRSLSGSGENPEVRRRLQERVREEGAEALLCELAVVDPETARRLSSQDLHRVIRALELYETTGMTMSEQIAASRRVPSPYRARVLLLDCRDREQLYRRINSRVDSMLNAGMEQEVRRVRPLLAGTARQAIGCKELLPWIEGRCTKEEAVDNLKQATRRYAKRQLTWFRKTEGVRLYIDEYPEKTALLRAALTALEPLYEQKGGE